MTRTLLATATALLLAGCGGGGSSAPAALPAVVVTSAPTAAPSGLPSASPAPSPTATHIATASPSASPVATATPTIAPLKVLRAAPLSANPVGLSFLRRPQAGGVTSSLPILVESSGTAAVWAGNFVTWVTDANTGLDVAEASGTITATNGVPVTNPSFGALVCPAASSTWCAVHPNGWQFGTASTNNKPVGKQILTVTFGDGLTGQIPDYIYDGWSIACNAGIAYVGGHVVPTTTQATSDIWADCAHANIVFPKAGALFANPAQDQYGRLETAFPSVTAGIFLVTQAVNFPMASIAHGAIYAINTQDGGMAKVYFDGASATTVTASSGMALHASVDNSYPF